MKIKEFKPYHLKQMDQWYLDRGLNPIDEDLLPRCGLIIEDVAACFLYGTDSYVAMIEGLVTNPKASIAQRRDAIDALIRELENLAKEAGFKYIIGLTKSKSTFKKALNLGYGDLGSYHMVSKKV